MRKGLVLPIPRECVAQERRVGFVDGRYARDSRDRIFERFGRKVVGGRRMAGLGPVICHDVHALLLSWYRLVFSNSLRFRHGAPTRWAVGFICRRTRTDPLSTISVHVYVRAWPLATHVNAGTTLVTVATLSRQ